MLILTDILGHINYATYGCWWIFLISKVEINPANSMWPVANHGCNWGHLCLLPWTSPWVSLMNLLGWGTCRLQLPRDFLRRWFGTVKWKKNILMVVFVYQIRPMSCDFTMWIVFASRFRNKQILGAAGNLVYRSGRDGEHEAILFRSQTPVIFDKSKALLAYVGIFPHDLAAVACNRYCLIWSHLISISNKITSAAGNVLRACDRCLPGKFNDSMSWCCVVWHVLQSWNLIETSCE